GHLGRLVHRRRSDGGRPPGAGAAGFDVPQGRAEPGADRLRHGRDQGGEGGRRRRLAARPAGTRVVARTDELRRRADPGPLHEPGCGGQRRSRHPDQGEVRSGQHPDRRRAVPDEGLGRARGVDPFGDGRAPAGNRRPVDGRADRQGAGDGRRPDALQRGRGHEQDGARSHLVHDPGSPRQQRLHPEYGTTGRCRHQAHRRHRDRRGGTRHGDQAGAGDARSEDLRGGGRAGEGHRRNREPYPPGGSGARPRSEAGGVRRRRPAAEGRSRQGLRDPDGHPAAKDHDGGGQDRASPETGRDRGPGSRDPAPREGVDRDRAPRRRGGAAADRDPGRSRAPAPRVAGERRRRGRSAPRAGRRRGGPRPRPGGCRRAPRQGRGRSERHAGQGLGIQGIQPGRGPGSGGRRPAGGRPRPGRTAGQRRQDHRRLDRSRRCRRLGSRSEPGYRRHRDDGGSSAGARRGTNRGQRQQDDRVAPGDETGKRTRSGRAGGCLGRDTGYIEQRSRL
ncbi:MAG: Inner membrane protein YqiK, partial [uncultured Thermomicrobiales bacterium]